MKQHHRTNHIRVTVVATMLSIILSVAPSAVAEQDIGVITYREGTQAQKIYAFLKSSNDHLHVNYWNGSEWQWADQGTPPGTTVSGTPGVITYREGTKPQRIYAFVRGANGKLYVNYWNGSQWKWTDQGTPPGTTVSDTPGVVTYREGTKPQRIYAFVRGANGKLYVNYWNGSQWKWADQGTPPGTTVSSTPGGTTYREGTKPQRIYAFVRGGNGKLYVNYWNGSKWQWADQGGVPAGIAVDTAPGVITYREGTKPQRIYAFVVSSASSDVVPPTLSVNYWNGSKWQWANQGYLDQNKWAAFSAPGVITYRGGTKSQRIYAFARRGAKLSVNYWNGSQWKWADQGTPPGTTVSGTPGVISYQEGSKPQRIYAFVRGGNGKLYVNYWNGSKWQWADQDAL